MAFESIVAGYLRPGFPKTTNNQKSYDIRLEYVGPYSILQANEPASDTTWGTYDGRVSGTTLEKIPGTTYGILTVVTQYRYDNPSGSGGTSRETVYEVEWVMFQRELIEHPEFVLGGSGTYTLTAEDISDLEAWKNEQNPENKADYFFSGGSSVEELSSNAKMFAKGIQLGQEYWEDYAPVIRKITTYEGGNPGDSEAGAKGSEPSFAGKPSGYEWRKTADRAIRSKGQTRWDRTEEWIGAETVLTDKDSIYWTAPS